MYGRELARLGKALREFEGQVGAEGPEDQRQILQTLEGVIEAYRGFVGRDPFMLNEIPPDIALIFAAS